ncbi:MAG TPA: radical SAM protein [Oribacterium sp.]|nr:radical SAM protein [Oribacterium sp.]
MMTIDPYEKCAICPRACGVDRTNNATGVCGVGADLYVARAALHFWEEPCISGKEGSGAVFFSGCTLKCVFCQNYELSHAEAGQKVSIEHLADIFLSLEQKGANNINLVTPDHYIPSVAKAMERGRTLGLRIPYVINCSGYETTSQIRTLDGLADIYLDDFKYMDPEKARKYSGAYDYPDRAKEALAEMVRQCPEPVFDKRGIMQKGVIVRHLLMPGMVHNAERIVEYIYSTYHDNVYLSLMHQFTPFPRLAKYPEINRRVTKREYARLLDFTLNLGVENAFIQEGSVAKESFIPDWNGEGLN